MDNSLRYFPMSSFSSQSVSVIDRLLLQINQKPQINHLSDSQKLGNPKRSCSISKLSALKKTHSASSNSHSNVFLRLNEDAKRKQLFLQLKREKEVQMRIEEEERFIKHKKMSREATNQLVNRMSDDVARRMQNLEQKRLSKQEVEEHEFDSLINAKHPKRKLNPTVQKRLLQEDKIIEALYGKPQPSKESTQIRYNH